MRLDLLGASIAALALWCAPAMAVETQFQGYMDFRLVFPPSERSWLDGGLGKLRFGSAQPSPDLRFAEAIGQESVDFSSDISAVAVVRIEPRDPNVVDLQEAYLAWRPPENGALQLATKLGAFFPPISLENEDLGWTSPYTITPSAINTWIGEELRTIGDETTLSWTRFNNLLSITGSLFCCNDPAGALIAARGWGLDDRPTGLFERLRLPDAVMTLYGAPIPGTTGEFEEIDGRVGWYLGATEAITGIGSISVIRYDNNGDPATYNDRDGTWKTRFWNVSMRTRIGGVYVLAQGLTGDTAIGAVPFLSVTNFDSAYVLAAYDIGKWRASARIEAFQTRTPGFIVMDEDGHAITLALSWMPSDWLKLSNELLLLDSRAGTRAVLGMPTSRQDVQYQTSVRFLL
jgi:hypothetical protein